MSPKKMDDVDKRSVSPYRFRREKNLSRAVTISEDDCVSWFVNAGAETECECGRTILVDHPMYTECKCGRVYFFEIILNLAMTDETYRNSKYSPVRDRDVENNE